MQKLKLLSNDLFTNINNIWTNTKNKLVVYR